MSPFDVGCKMGLNLDESIMLQEYMENVINDFMKSVFVSAS